MCTSSDGSTVLITVYYFKSHFSADKATVLASSGVLLGVKRNGISGRRYTFPKRPRVLGSPGADLSVGWLPYSHPSSCTLTPSSSADTGVDYNLVQLVGSFENRADKGTGCWVQHSDWLLGSCAVDTRAAEAAPQDQSRGFHLGPSQA